MIIRVDYVTEKKYKEQKHKWCNYENNQHTKNNAKFMSSMK